MITTIRCTSPVLKQNSENDLRATINNVQTRDNAELRIKFPDINQFSSVVSKKAIDFFFISAYVYGIDRFVSRSTNSVDGWSREISATFPVYEIQLWRNSKSILESTLSFLTGDYWTVDFEDNTYQIAEEELSEEYNRRQYEQVSLFSGGLDSLIGAIDFLAREENIEKNLLLVSHFDYKMKGPNRDQEDLLNAFPAEYNARIKRVSLTEVSLAKSSIKDLEKTFRSRSLLFLGIAVVAADFRKSVICVPENGSISLNYPLSSSRRGSCSTRTTHPRFISFVRELLGSLGLTDSIETPYEFHTKGEMVTECLNPDLLQQLLQISNSCGKRGHTVNRTIQQSTHCGVCMPCTYRRASLLDVQDDTVYGDDLNKNTVGVNNVPFLLSKQGQDLNACLDFLGSELSDDEIRTELIISGVNDFSKIDRYVNLVQKTRAELRTLVNATCNIQERRTQAGL